MSDCLNIDGAGGKMWKGGGGSVLSIKLRRIRDCSDVILGQKLKCHYLSDN